MTKLRKLQRACSLGDFFEAREVTHDILLSRIKMRLGSAVQTHRETAMTGSGVVLEEVRGLGKPRASFPFSEIGRAHV